MMKDFGKRLLDLRNEKGLTREAFAEILGVSGQTVSNWEEGHTLPDYKELRQIEARLKVDVGRLTDEPILQNSKTDKTQVSIVLPVAVLVLWLFHMAMAVCGRVPYFYVLSTPTFIAMVYLIMNAVFRTSIKKNDDTMTAGYKNSGERIETIRNQLILHDFLSGLFAVLCELLFLLVYYIWATAVNLILFAAYVLFEIVIDIVLSKKRCRR